MVVAACEDAVSVIMKLDQFDEHRAASGRNSMRDSPN
jgi:hypothetical protein